MHTHRQTDIREPTACMPTSCIMQDSQSQAQPDELIDFHHLKARRGMSQLEIEDQVQTDLQRATGLAETGSENAARLNRVLQLTGKFARLLWFHCHNMACLAHIGIWILQITCWASARQHCSLPQQDSEAHWRALPLAFELPATALISGGVSERQQASDMQLTWMLWNVCS